MRPCPALLLAAAALACGPAQAGPVLRYLGIASDPTGRTVYQEEHLLRSDDEGGEERVVLYRCPGGEPFARKRLTRPGSSFLPRFELADRRAGWREGIAAVAAGLVAFAGPIDAAAPRRPLPPPAPDWVADAGFDAFIMARRDELEAGRVLRFEFLLPTEARPRTLRVRKLGEGEALGRPASRYRLELGAWYRLLAPHIDGWYDRGSGRLLRYEGLSNLRSPSGDNFWVRIDFPPSQRQAGIAAEQLDQALRKPLVGHCPGLSPDAS